MLLLILFYLLCSSNAYIVVPTLNIADSILMYDATINILKSCSHEDFRTVGVYNVPNYLISKIFTSAGFTTVNINGNKKYFEDLISDSPKLLQRPQYFIIEMSIEHIISGAGNITSSILWNPAAKVFVLNNSSKNCTGAESFLINIWEVFILNAIYVCINQKKNVVFYTLNPYDKNAPEPWEKSKEEEDEYDYEYDDEYKDKDEKENSVITIYKRVYDEHYCESIFFVKTNTLDGFRCTLNAKADPPLLTINENTLKKVKKYKGIALMNIGPDEWDKLFYGFDNNIIGTIFKFLNATTVILIYPENTFLGGLHRSSRSHAKMKGKKLTASDASDTLIEDHLPGNDIDIGLNTRYILSKGSTAVLYPVLQSEMSIVTNDRGNVDLLTRILAFFNTGVAVSIIIISGVAIIVLRFLGFQTYGSAGMNAIRFLLGTAIQQIPNSLPVRIILGCLMPYFLIMVATFQGYYAHILIVPRTANNVDKVKDLETIRHNVYAGNGFSEYYKTHDERFKNLENISSDHCADVVLKNHQAACIDDGAYLKFHAARNETLHIMKEPLEKVYTTYPTRKTWPLIDRINILMSRLKESGILNFWWSRTLADSEKSIINSEINRITKVVRKLNLEKLKIFFIFLIIGLSLSTIVFIFEILIY